MASALEGLKILDFSWVGAGPITTTWLAQHGATVIRIESARRPDTLRTGQPYKDKKPGINRSGYFAWFNVNKYSLALDLNNPEAMAVVTKLVQWADVAVENFTPGRMEKWGLGYDELARLKPDIVFLRLSIYGQTGPLASHLGFGPFIAGLVGMQHLTGWPDRGPVQVAGPSDQLAPDYAVCALLAALDYRNKTGKGECIDLSQCEVSLQTIAPNLLDYFANGNEGGAHGNTSPFACPHAAYRCRGEDRWCAIAACTEEQWQALCGVIGRPELAGDQRFTSLAARKENEVALDTIVGEWTARHAAEEVMALMQAAGVPAGIVANGEDLLLDPQLKLRRRFWHLEHPVIGNFYHLGEPYNLLRTRAEPRLPAPCLGEHTDFVCREVLHMDDAEFLKLFGEGVFE